MGIVGELGIAGELGLRLPLLPLLPPPPYLPISLPPLPSSLVNEDKLAGG